MDLKDSKSVVRAAEDWRRGFVCVCVAQLYGGRELEDSERIVRAGEGVCVCLCGACTLRFGEEIAGKVAEGCHQWCSFH